MDRLTPSNESKDTVTYSNSKLNNTHIPFIAEKILLEQIDWSSGITFGICELLPDKY